MPTAPSQRRRAVPVKTATPQRNSIPPRSGGDDWKETDPQYLPQDVAEDITDADAWYTERTTDTAAIQGGALTVVGPISNVPIVAGRRYKVTFYARTLNLSNATDEIEVRIEKDAGAGFSTIGDGKWQGGTDGENAGGITVIAIYKPTGTANVDFRVKAEKMSGPGTGHVLGATDSSPMYLLIEPVPNVAG